MMFLAQLGLGAGGKGGGSFMQLIIPFGLMFAIMYFLMIRPQRKKEKERKEKLTRIRKNDKVITNGGVHGKVVSIKENSLVICIDETKDVNVKVDRNSIGTIMLAEEEE
ncbi:MAG: preprotein translocase subunit YajC [Candidatus Anammoxibacter sp.]